MGAVANMIVGFLWYGPLFGKPWSKLMGWGEMTPEKMVEIQKKARPAYIATFIGALLMSYVMAHAVIFGSTYTGTFGVIGGMTAAFWYWLGIVVPVTMGTVFWDGKPWKLWFINAGYYLVVMLIMGAVLGGWTH